MLSDELESLARAVEEMDSVVSHESVRTTIVCRLTAMAIDARALERHVVPFTARPMVIPKGGNIVDFAREFIRRRVDRFAR